MLNAYDFDGDGRPELIATKAKSAANNWYGTLCWLKAVDPIKGKQGEHPIGVTS